MESSWRILQLVFLCLNRFNVVTNAGKKMKNKKVTKNNLVESIYNSSEMKLDKSDIQLIIDNFLGQLKVSLENGSVIELRGFGTFEPRLRKAKINAKNPRTGESVQVDAHYVAAFRAGQELKEKLWNLKIDDE